MANNLLSKVNLNGTELVIADMGARNTANTASTSASTNASNITDLTTRVTHIEEEADIAIAYMDTLVRANYDEQSSTLSLTSKS